MVITLQKYFKRYYQSKNTERVHCENVYYCNDSDLDLREYKKLKILYFSKNEVTSIDLSGCKELTHLDVWKKEKPIKVEKEDKSTQTDLVGEQVKNPQEIQRGVQELTKK